ncbi:helix-hairpin-helix domain-containing protein [Desulfovibrio sp. JC022]|uniref:helix-hairpin-helix domain-containing protein n=1 Tax=Desulfovibrio sp. JC022 TaxID=2593642 RepID=UPI0013D62417|nr:helix-hairpin-helix domain-containing protein [Desulfovibrio sp. JC022]NDV23146.1 pathogenicity locus [Desulfovibrio sp. JC022]
MKSADPEILKDFRTIPGVGKSIAMDLWNMGYRSLDEIKGENPDDMYARLEELAGCHVDRCMLYVFRCAVYYVGNEKRDPELEKWWNWKD